jgi:hypothetical protein
MVDVANRDVFINCPFDDEYKPLFYAFVFTVVRSGFRVRCALEADDGADNRFAKICAIVAECRYGIHDISRTGVDGDPPLPRFNMPLELGLFLGAKRYGGRRQKAKCCIIFDRERYRYQRFMSDIAGQDIHAHNGDEATAIGELASWLRARSRHADIPGGRVIFGEYRLFLAALPSICADRGLSIEELTFGDYSDIVVRYLTVQRS